MRHNSFQKIYASYIAPNPDMDVLWMDLKADPYGSVIKFWNGGIGKYELISSDASTIGKHIIYADDVELPVRSIINFKGFDISENQPEDQLIISIDNKEDAGTAQSIVDHHESEFNHSDIDHSNRAALNSVSGVNTGDQDLSGLASKSELSDALLLKVDKEAGKQLSTEDYTSQEKVKLAGISENANNYILPSDVVHDANYVHTDNNFTDSLFITLGNQSGVNTGDQDLGGLVEKKANHSLVPDLEIEKLAGIEENANNYIHPETHPSSILDVVDVVDGAANKFMNERGEMLAVVHESLTNKNSEAAFQHVDTTTTKPTLDEADMVAVKDSVTGNIVLTPKSNLGSDNKINPIGAQAFKNGSTIGISQLNRPISGSMTAVKRFNAATSAYDAPLVSISNSSGDSIFLGNVGYTFTIRLKKNNVQIFQFTEASSIIFNNPSKITLFAEIDYDKLEIRISYSGYSRSISVPELSQLKNTIFTNSQYCIYSYNQSKDWYLIRGLINQLNRNFVFLGTSDLDYIDSKFMFYKDVDLSTYIDNSVRFVNSQKSFIDGKVTFDRPTDSFPATHGGFPIFLNVDLGDTPIYGTQLIETFSFDVNAGYFILECGTVSRVSLYRLINKVTGEITDVRPNADRNVRITIPVGRYVLRIEYNVFQSGWQYRSFLYECSTDFNITIYKDMKIISGCCYQVAIPQLMTYNKLLCEAQNKVYSGIINPSVTY